MERPKTLTVTFKTPDAVRYALDNAFGAADPFDDEESEEEVEETEEEKEERETFRAEAEEVLEKFIEHGEYLTVEVDLEKKTARVVPVKG